MTSTALSSTLKGGALILLLALIYTGLFTADRTTWLMEVTPVIIIVPLLLSTHRRYPLTPLHYTLIFFHALILIGGGMYTYAPLTQKDEGIFVSAAWGLCAPIMSGELDTDSYLLDFPNDEVRSGFLTLVASSYLKPSKSTDAWVIQVIDVMSKGDCHQLENLMTSFFASIPYNQRRKDDEREKERYFQYTFFLVLRMISCFTVFIEKQQSEGRVDCVVETPNYIYIFEFKRDGSAEEALKQIEDMGYAREYAADGRKIYQIGCNFSSKTGTIDGWKMK